jgi:hypothetical protein
MVLIANTIEVMDTEVKDMDTKNDTIMTMMIK